MSNEGIPSKIAWTYFTDAQRRRAEALLLTRLLFPSVNANQSAQIAQWITRGHTDVEVRL